MKFTMQRNRTISSTSGHAIEFKKGEPVHVPPCMYEEVMAAGAVPEEELDLDPKASEDIPPPAEPEARKKAIFDVFEKIVLRARREDFTASGAPHAKVVSQMLGWTVVNKERDTLWVAFQQRDADE